MCDDAIQEEPFEDEEDPEDVPYKLDNSHRDWYHSQYEEAEEWPTYDDWYYDDWDFFIDEVQPKPLTEWIYCLRWLSAGQADGSTTTSCLGRTEAGLDGSDVGRTEVLLARPFSAGTLRAVLSSVDAGATWLISGVQVHIASDFLPSGPLDTWHSTGEPFREPPPPPPEEPEEPVEE